MDLINVRTVSATASGIYGKVLRKIEEVRRAVGKFVGDYNAE
jgi:hypothetical protein